MTTIYGLRRKGETEIRYIGRTTKPLALRLKRHIQNAKRTYPPKISAWIRRSPTKIEIVALFECSPEHATNAERGAVEMYYGLGHNLTNSHLLPSRHVVALARAA